MYAITRRIGGEVRPSYRARRVEELVHKRKLIEVALPLETINRESAREKSIRHGHPSTLHLWWSRKPLAAARAVLFAQLVDDPSARPAEFPTEDDQRRERERLHRMIESLVVWENSRDQRLLAEAHAEIVKSTGANPPPILDPFAGGGTIPLEAQRLGLDAHASDLNPVAVLINKALIEIPPRFRDHAPVFPGLAESQIPDWRGAEGLAADVRAYGQWIRDEAERRVGHLYPKATVPDGSIANVIAWIWARTVTCPNPACAIEMPLSSKWWLGKKKGKEAYVVPTVQNDSSHPSGRRVSFAVGHGATGSPTKDSDGTIISTGAVCVACRTTVPFAHLRSEAQHGRLGYDLMAIACQGTRTRIYLPASEAHLAAAAVDAPTNVPDAPIADQAIGFRVQAYGMTRWADLFTNRQLVSHSTFSDLVQEARQIVFAQSGSDAYADAVATYLGLAMSRSVDRQSALCSWDASPTKEQVRGVFARQAISMVWDVAEANPFAKSSGTWTESVEWVAKALERLPAAPQGSVVQASAETVLEEGMVISADPPYYNYVGYSDLSDFFYVWLRRSLADVHPELFGTLLVPKTEELVANPFRHAGVEGARSFFETGFRSVFAEARRLAHPDVPMTVYYAFKESESKDGVDASSGWETLLEGMIQAGWEISSTWPLRSELTNRLRSIASNALASSIVLSLRPRPENAATTDRRGFISALEAELPEALRRLQQGQVAPVDLPQATIGPGMAVFSRFDAVLEPDGQKMTVRAALARINEILDQVLNAQEGDFDPTSRFAIAWYRLYGYGIGDFGDANNLANARNANVQAMDRDEILTSRGGIVQLIKSADLPWEYDVLKDLHTSNWEALHHLIKVLERDGIALAGEFLQAALTRPDAAVDGDLVKELAHLLFRIAEGNGWTKDALSFNSLVTSWPEILDAARSVKKSVVAQEAFDFDGGDD